MTEVSNIDETSLSAAEGVPSDANLIPTEELKKATYSGIYEAPVTLVDGLYEGEPIVDSEPSRPTIQYVVGRELFGDLNGDGAEDAAVFLLENSGGTAIFTYIAAQLNQDGQPVDAGAAMIADRTQVRSATIKGGQIKLEITVPGPGDGDCCPSYKADRIYELQSGLLGCSFGHLIKIEEQRKTG